MYNSCPHTEVSMPTPHSHYLGPIARRPVRCHNSAAGSFLSRRRGTLLRPPVSNVHSGQRLEFRPTVTGQFVCLGRMGRDEER